MSYKSLVVNVDEIGEGHDYTVLRSFRDYAVPKTIFATVDRSYNKDPQVAEPDVSSAKLLGYADVINWSFSLTRYVNNYDYGDTVIKQGYLKNTAFTTSAGNNGLGFIVGLDGVGASFSTIGKYQSTPYDFTVGAIDTFDWRPGTETLNEQNRALKLAKFELADFSEVAPKFVDFYAQGDAGTSYAAPRVAGLITYIKDYDSTYTLNQIRTVLERNSKHMTFTRDGNTWIAQVLDPWDLENNKVRDGRLGYSATLFSDNITREDYTWTFDPKHVIDKWTKVDALFEVIRGTNSDPEELKTWMQSIDKNNWTLQKTVDEFWSWSNKVFVSNYFSTVPLIERVQGLFHLGLDREPTTEETVQVIDYYNSIDNNWSQLVTTFIGVYNVDLATQNW